MDIACSYGTASVAFLCQWSASKRIFIEPIRATINVGWPASQLIAPVKPAFVRGISERVSADWRIYRSAAFDRPKTDHCTRSTRTMDGMRRQPSGSCTVRSFLDNLRPAFSVSHQFQDFQSSLFGPEWDGFDSFVEDISDCYRQKPGRKEAMTIVMGACGSQLTDSLEEMLLDPVVPASNKRPVQEYRPVSSLEYYTDVSGVRPRVALRCTLLVSSEEALHCVMETDAEPVVSVFQGALQLDSLCLKASNQHSVVLRIPGELAEVIMVPRFSCTLSCDPAQVQREPCKRRPLRFVLWPEDVDYCGSLLRSCGIELSAKEEQGAQNHRRNRRAIERAVHPLSGQMTRKIPETVAVAEPCFELSFFSDISREEPEHPHLLTE